MTAPRPVYSVAAVRAAEQLAAANAGVELYDLMLRAGQAAFSRLRVVHPWAARLLVLCGPGNNGGDGYVLAQLAAAAGLAVTVVAPVAPATSDARRAAAAAGLTPAAFDERLLAAADVVVDALFGCGLKRALEAPWQALIGAVNASDRPVFALDVPSGLDADSGAVHGNAISATDTVTFVAAKPGLYLGEGPDLAGVVSLAELEVDDRALVAAVPELVVLGDADLLRALPRRARTAHKGSNGRVLIVAGGPGMGGAARLAGLAALRAGAGLVTIAAHPGSLAVISAVPELICHGVDEPRALRALIAAADVVAVGPGLGRTPWAQALLGEVLAGAAALVIDADALNELATRPVPPPLPPAVLTPHPAEAARLLGLPSAADVQAARLASVRALRDRFAATVVLKGAATLIASGAAPVAVCTAGNPGMATAGTGDVLTGVIAAIAAQQADLAAAPQVALARATGAAVLAHARAGDLAAANGERGLIASDLIGALRAVVNPGRARAR